MHTCIHAYIHTYIQTQTYIRSYINTNIYIACGRKGDSVQLPSSPSSRKTRDSRNSISSSKYCIKAILNGPGSN